MKTKTIKMLAMIIVIATMLSLVAGFTNVSKASSADLNNGKLTLNNVSGKVGDEVTVKITASQVLSIENDGLLLKYDSSKLQYVNSTTSTANPVLMIGANDTENGVKIALMSFDMTGAKVTVPKDTVLATVTFKILEGAVAGVTSASGLQPISLTLVHEEEEGQPTLATGKVNISAPVQSISLNKTTLNLKVGQSENLAVTLNPVYATGNVTWSSSNSNIVKVENGKVTAVNNGTATITAKVGNLTKTCEVKVNTPLEGITLNKNSVNLVKGASTQLEITYVPEKANNIPAAIWTSSDSTVAKVENGKITALKEGNATVTVKVGAYSESCAVKVNEIHLNSISLDTDELEIALGKSKTVSILYNPANTTDDITKTVWSSSDNNVATVVNGKITAKSIGTAVITAKLEGKEASVTVTVPEVLIQGVSLVAKKTTLEVNAKTTLEIKTNPLEVTEEVNAVFSSSDENVLTVSQSGEVTALKVGKAKVTVTVNDEFTKTVDIEVVEKAPEVEKPEELPDKDNGNSGTTEQKPSMPETGDIAIEVFAALVVISIVGIVVLLVKRNKNK